MKLKEGLYGGNDDVDNGDKFYFPPTHHHHHEVARGHESVTPLT